MADEKEPGAAGQIPAGKCPICAKPREMAYRPFCSKRCQQVDLGRWLGEVYAIPVTELNDEDGEQAERATLQRPLDN